MIKSCFIACYDEIIKNLIINDIKAVNGSMAITVIPNEGDLIYNLRNSSEVNVYFDKYFLGYILKYKLTEYKVINPKANIIFVEKGDCPLYFGLRLYYLGVNGFICGIEELGKIKNALLETFEKIKSFPEEVINSIKNNINIINRKDCSEVTEKELEVGLYKGQGKSIKEICALLGNIATGTAGIHMSRLYKKIGFKSIKDLMILNKRVLKEEQRNTKKQAYIQI